MARDDFSKPTIEVLAKRVGTRCSNPNCRQATAGPRAEANLAINIGVAAHITAASKGGPRYDATFSPEQRQSPENGIWLCQNCAKLVDNDPERYLVEALRDWKRNAESAALAEIEGLVGGKPAAPAIDLILRRRDTKITQERHEYQLEVVLKNTGTEPFGPYHIDLELPRAVVINPDDQYMLLRDRSTRETAFFRAISATHRPREVIYPGDAKTIMSIAYFMDDKLFRVRSDLFGQPVKATLYPDKLQPLVVEGVFEHFQNF